VVARKWLAQRGVSVRGYMARIGEVVPRAHDWSAVEDNPFFWPCADQVAELEAYMDALRKSGDSVGPKVVAVADGVPPGRGQPVVAWLGAGRCTASTSASALRGGCRLRRSRAWRSETALRRLRRRV